MADQNKTTELRLFIAVDLPPSATDALAKAIESLRADLRGPYRWVSARGIHLTLKFLGNVGNGRVPRIAEAMAGAAGRHAGFALRLNGTGTFPPDGSPNVIWAGLDGGTDELSALQRSIEESLVPLGFAPEQRAFNPHLTLARVRNRLGRPDVERLTARLAQVRYDDDGPFAVDHVSLIRSELGPGGARYTTLAEARLGSG